MPMILTYRINVSDTALIDYLFERCTKEHPEWQIRRRASPGMSFDIAGKRILFSLLIKSVDDRLIAGIPVLSPHRVFLYDYLGQEYSIIWHMINEFNPNKIIDTSFKG
jgi:hypothetical protein